MAKLTGNTRSNKLIWLSLILTTIFLLIDCGQGKSAADAAGQAQEREQAVINCLTGVPEIGDFVKQHKANGLVLELQASPDPQASDRYLHDYYRVYIGLYIKDNTEAGHRTRWGTFLVNAGLNEILWENPANGKYATLEEWRKSNQAENNANRGSVTDRVCIPFQKVGPITPNTTEAELNRLFGADKVQRRTIMVAEGTEQRQVSVILPDTPNELILFWRDNNYGGGPKAVWIRRGGEWQTAQGIKVGTSLEELNRINGKPFGFYGFGWDYSGVVNRSWGGGTLATAHGLSVTLRPVGELPRQYYGDKTLNSSDAGLLPDLIRVGAMDIQLSQ